MCNLEKVALIIAPILLFITLPFMGIYLNIGKYTLINENHPNNI
jgi:hypothetical protein